MGREESRDPLEKLSIGLAVYGKLAHRLSLVRDLDTLPSLLVGLARGRAEHEIALLEERDSGPDDLRFLDQRRSRGAQHVVRLGFPFQYLIERREGRRVTLRGRRLRTP